MVLFACDLDHTLFYPSSKSLPNDICVEIRKECATTFITAKSYHLLAQLQNYLHFVPCTTRNLTQYRRLHIFAQDITPRYALIDNGSTLLINGKIDPKWQEETEYFILEAQSAMKKGYNLLQSDRHRTHTIQNIGDSLIFTCSNNPQKTIRRLLAKLNTNMVAIQQNGAYIYLTPQTLNKGFALKRLLNIQSSEYIIGAGDALFDVPMLRLSNSCYVPSQSFARRYLANHPHTYYPTSASNEPFSDMMLISILKRFERNEFNVQ